MRKFYLRNGIGEVKPLNGENGIWLTDPSGLGVVFTKKFTNINNGFYARTSSVESQGSISGTITFTRTAYKSYVELINWIEQAKTLTLVYKPTNTEYYRDIEVKSLTKTELEEAHWLNCPVVLHCLTPWYLPSNVKLNITEQISDAARYSEWRYGVNRYGLSATGDYTADVQGNGHTDAAIKLTFKGEISNPVFTLRDDSGEIIGRCAITVSTASTDTLEICSEFNNCYVKRITAEGVETDLIDSVNLSYDPWLHVPVGENCTLQITADSISGAADAVVLYYYRSV